MKEKMERKIFTFKVEEAEADENTGIIKGLASTFMGIDQGDDRIKRGAFKKTLLEREAFPMLLDHNPRKPAGMQRLKETRKGLHFEAELKLFDPDVRQRFELAKQALEFNAPMGVSIGFRPVKFSFDEVDGVQIRNLEEIKLFETSLVTFPMNVDAMVTGAKSEILEDLLDAIQDGRYTLEEIKTALAQLESRESSNGRAAPIQDDPALIQSFEKLRAAITR